MAIIEAHTFIYSTKVCVHMRNTADEDEADARGAYFPLFDQPVPIHILVEVNDQNSNYARVKTLPELSGFLHRK